MDPFPSVAVLEHVPAEVDRVESSVEATACQNTGFGWSYPQYAPEWRVAASKWK